MVLYVLMAYAYAAAWLGLIVLLRTPARPGQGCGPKLVAGVVNAGLVAVISLMWVLANSARGDGAVRPANLSLGIGLVIGTAVGTLWPVSSQTSTHEES